MDLSDIYQSIYVPFEPTDDEVIAVCRLAMAAAERLLGDPVAEAACRLNAEAIESLVMQQIGEV